MKGIFIILIAFLMCMPVTTQAQNNKQKRVITALASVYENDTIPSFEIMEVTIYSRKNAANIKKTRKYDKMLRDVLKTYPLAKEVKAVLVETYLYLQTLPDDEAREKHIEEVEKGVWDQYLPIMKKMTLSQGKMLIKLIDRECNQTSYRLIQAFMGNFKAGFYQAFAGLFGASLKKEYDPDGDDAEIEDIIYLIDNDMLRIIN